MLWVSSSLGLLLLKQLLVTRDSHPIVSDHPMISIRSFYDTPGMPKNWHSLRKRGGWSVRVIPYSPRGGTGLECICTYELTTDATRPHVTVGCVMHIQSVEYKLLNESHVFGDISIHSDATPRWHMCLHLKEDLPPLQASQNIRNVLRQQQRQGVGDTIYDM